MFFSIIEWGVLMSMSAVSRVSNISSIEGVNMIDSRGPHQDLSDFLYSDNTNENQ